MVETHRLPFVVKDAEGRVGRSRNGRPARHCSFSVRNPSECGAGGGTGGMAAIYFFHSTIRPLTGNRSAAASRRKSWARLESKLNGGIPSLMLN